MNLLQKLKYWWGDPPVEVPPVEPVEDVYIAAPVQGHVVTAVKSPIYTPNTHRYGGRVVKAMPKQLKQMKEAQEHVEDDL